MTEKRTYRKHLLQIILSFDSNTVHQAMLNMGVEPNWEYLEDFLDDTWEIVDLIKLSKYCIDAEGNEDEE